MVAKVTYHRDGMVCVDGVLVGKLTWPDLSNGAWLHTPVWTYRDVYNDEEHTAPVRRLFDDIARATLIRITRDNEEMIERHNRKGGPPELRKLNAAVARGERWPGQPSSMMRRTGRDDAASDLP